MRVNPVSSTVFSKISCPKNDVQKSRIENNFSKECPVFPVFPRGYVLSFKGEEPCQEIKNFENFLDDFYEKHKGKPIEDIDNFNTFGMPKAESSRIDYEFQRMINASLKSQSAPLINEETLKKTLTQGLLRFGAEDNAGEVVKKLKEKGQLPDKISIEPKSKDFRILLSAIRKELISYHEEWDEDDKEFFLDSFNDDFMECLKKNNKPVFDENLLKKMKANLKEEPFKTFDETVKKIRIEDEKNGFPSAQKCAQEVFEESIEKKISPFDSPKMYDFVSKNSAGLGFLIEKLYGSHSDFYNKCFDESGIAQKHKALLIDPGVAAHVEELVQYVKEKNIDTNELEPFSLRQGFSEYLGTETVYRGLYSKKPEELVEKLKRDGNYAVAYKNPENVIEAIKYYLTRDSKDGFTVYDRVVDKIKNSSKSEFLSVTSVYDIAASVAKPISRPDYPVVVIETEIPKLSLMKQEGRFAAMQTNARHKTLHIGDKRFSYDRDMSKIEIFVPFHMPVVKSKITIDTSTPNLRWNDD